MVWKKKGEDVAAQVALIALLILTQVHSAYPRTGVLYGQLLILTQGPPRGSLHRRPVVHSQLDSDALRITEGILT